MKKTAQKGFTLIELMIVVAIIGILAAVALPQYQTYVAKSQVSRVMTEIGAIKTVIETCLLEGRDTPIDPPAAGVAVAPDECVVGFTGSSLLVGVKIPTTPGTGLGPIDITIDGADDSTLIGTFGNSAAATLKDKTLTWTRTLDGSWSCSTDVESKYAPNGCPVE